MTYFLSHQEWIEISTDLQPSELKILYYLRTLAPPETELQLRVDTIAEDLGLHTRTISRALRQLANLDLIELEIVTFLCKVRGIKKSPSGSNYPEVDQIIPDGIKKSPDGSKNPDLDQNVTSLLGFSQKFSTGDTRERSLNLSDQELLAFVEKQSGHAKNPRAYAKKCLQNDRTYWEERFREFMRPPQVAATPPDRFQIEGSCQAAIDAGDRSFALSKLDSTWKAGFQDLVEEIILCKPHWGFALTNGGVRDDHRES